MERTPNPASPEPTVPSPEPGPPSAAGTPATSGPTAPAAGAHYRRPGRSTRVMNGVVRGLTRMGVSVAGSRTLEVAGRTSGLPRRTPVNLLRLDGGEYLVAARGTTEWVRNVRAAGGQVTLQVGRRRDRRVAVELVGVERIPVLRAYLARWSWEVGAFFDGVGADASDADLAAAADRHPVFRLQPAQAAAA